MKIARGISWLFCAGLLVSAPAFSRGKDLCTPQVQQGWIRLMPGGMPMHAGFGRIDNRCAQPITIVAAKSASYGDVELHESRVIDGVNRMRQLKELRIAPKDAVTLKPGGLHLMLMGGKAALQEGQRVPLVLGLSDGTQVRGEMVVRRP